MDAKEINQLAHLARINISETMVDEVTKNITDILQLVDQLQAADTQGVEPMAHPMDAKQILRKDRVTEADQREALQAVAPAVAEGLFLVPKVID